MCVFLYWSVWFELLIIISHMYSISTFATLSNVLKFVVASLVKGVHIGYVFLYKEKQYLSIIVNVYNYSVKRKQRWLDDLSVCVCIVALCSCKK